MLHKDSNNIIRLFNGIKDNGISSTRVRYHFYKSSEYNIFLVEDSIVNIEPTFVYTENSNIEHENFEGVGTNIDTTLNSEIDFEIKTENGNKFAIFKIDGNYLKFEAIDRQLCKSTSTRSRSTILIELSISYYTSIGAHK